MTGSGFVIFRRGPGMPGAAIHEDLYCRFEWHGGGRHVWRENITEATSFATREGALRMAEVYITPNYGIWFRPEESSVHEALLLPDEAP